MWKNGDPLTKTITIENVSGKKLTWENLATRTLGGGAYFDPAGFGAKACPAVGAEFKVAASCEANVKIGPWVAGKNGYLEVEFKDEAGVRRLEADPLETK